MTYERRNLFDPDQPRDERGQWTSVYHGTVDSQIESIKKNGLRREHAGKIFPIESKKDTVYVTTTRESAKGWARDAAQNYHALYGTRPRPVIIEVRLPKEAAEKLRVDRNFADLDDLVGVTGSVERELPIDVPPEWITGIWEHPKLAGEEWVRAASSADGMTIYVVLLLNDEIKVAGGPGSGNFGHAGGVGGPGNPGGSTSSGVSTREDVKDFLETQLAKFGGLARADALNWAHTPIDAYRDRLIESFKPHLTDLHIALRQKYGKTLTVYRAQSTDDVSQGVKSFSLTREGAQEFIGQNYRQGVSNVLYEVRIPVESILAIGSSYSGEVLVDTIRKVYRTRSLRGPLKFAFNIASQEAVDWADRHAAELIDGITETTREAINNAIAEGLEYGDIESAYEEILDAVGDKARARLIAHTETMQAASAGQRLAWDQAVDEGLLTGNEKRTWIAVGDDKMCDICAHLDEQVVGLDEEYTGPDGEKYEGPSAHPTCRCTEGLVT